MTIYMLTSKTDDILSVSVEYVDNILKINLSNFRGKKYVGEFSFSNKTFLKLADGLSYVNNESCECIMFPSSAVLSFSCGEILELMYDDIPSTFEQTHETIPNNILNLNMNNNNYLKYHLIAGFILVCVCIKSIYILSTGLLLYYGIYRSKYKYQNIIMSICIMIYLLCDVKEYDHMIIYLMMFYYIIKLIIL